MLKIAIQSKGRLNEESLSLLQSIGINVDEPKRKFLSKARNFDIEALFLRDDDIPAVVASGTAALGIVGRVLHRAEIRHMSISPASSASADAGSALRYRKPTLTAELNIFRASVLRPPTLQS